MNPRRRRLVSCFFLLIFCVALMPKCAYAQTQPLTAEQAFNQEVERLRAEFAQQIDSVSVSAAAVAPQTPNGCQVVALTDEETEIPTSSQNVKLVEKDDAALGVKYYQSETYGMVRLLAWQRWGFDPLRQLLHYQVAVRTKVPTLLNVVQIDSNGNPADFIVKEVRGTGDWEVFIGLANPEHPNLAVSVSQDSDIVDFDALALIACDTTEMFVPHLGANAYRGPQDCGEGYIGRPRYGQTNEEIAFSLFLEPGAVHTLASDVDYVCWQKRQTTAYDPDTGEVIDFFGKDRDQYRGLTVVPITLASVETVPFWSSGVVATVGRAAPLGSKVLAGLSGWGILLGVVSVVWYGWDSYVASQDPRYERAALPYSYPEEGRVFYEQRFVDDPTLSEGTAKYFIYRTDQVLANGQYQDWVKPEQVVGVFAVNRAEEALRGFVITIQDDTRKFIPGSYSYQVLVYLSQIVGEIEEEVGDYEDQHPAGPISEGEGKLLADELTEVMGREKEIVLYPEIEGICREPVDDLDVIEILQTAFVDWPPSIKNEAIDAIRQDRMEDHYSDPLYGRVAGSGAAIHFPNYTFRDGKKYHIMFVCVAGEGYAGWYKLDEFDEDYDPVYFPYEYEQ